MASEKVQYDKVFHAITAQPSPVLASAQEQAREIAEATYTGGNLHFNAKLRADIEAALTVETRGRQQAEQERDEAKGDYHECRDRLMNIAETLDAAGIGYVAAPNDGVVTLVDQRDELRGQVAALTQALKDYGSTS